jgi:hypothetical protein
MYFLKFFFLFENLYIIELKVYIFIFQLHLLSSLKTHLSLNFMQVVRTIFFLLFVQFIAGLN